MLQLSMDTTFWHSIVLVTIYRRVLSSFALAGTKEIDDSVLKRLLDI